MAALPARNLELEAAALAKASDADAWRVYADWLSSVGDPRGELVNLSFRLHAKDAYRSERAAIRAQLSALAQPFATSWREWAEARGLGRFRPRFVHGFVRSLVGPMQSLSAEALAELFARDPIQRLRLSGVDDDGLVRLCAGDGAWARGLRYLKLEGQVGARGAAALAELSLPRLEGLNLLATGIDAEACAQLRHLDTQRLGSLTLTANAIDDAGLALLLEARSREQWRKLYLSGNQDIRGEGLASLASTPGLGGLEGLYLKEIGAAFADCEAILDSPTLSGLKTLELSGWGSHRQKELLGRMQARWGAGLRLY